MKKTSLKKDFQKRTLQEFRGVRVLFQYVGMVCLGIFVVSTMSLNANAQSLASSILHTCASRLQLVDEQFKESSPWNQAILVEVRFNSPRNLGRMLRTEVDTCQFPKYRWVSDQVLELHSSAELRWLKNDERLEILRFLSIVKREDPAAKLRLPTPQGILGVAWDQLHREDPTLPDRFSTFAVENGKTFIMAPAARVRWWAETRDLVELKQAVDEMARSLGIRAFVIRMDWLSAETMDLILNSDVQELSNKRALSLELDLRLDLPRHYPQSVGANLRTLMSHLRERTFDQVLAPQVDDLPDQRVRLTWTSLPERFKDGSRADALGFLEALSYSYLAHDDRVVEIRLRK